jgi:hypothetical protein
MQFLLFFLLFIIIIIIYFYFIFFCNYVLLQFILHSMLSLSFM